MDINTTVYADIHIYALIKRAVHKNQKNIKGCAIEEENLSAVVKICPNEMLQIFYYNSC